MWLADGRAEKHHDLIASITVMHNLFLLSQYMNVTILKPQVGIIQFSTNGSISICKTQSGQLFQLLK